VDALIEYTKHVSFHVPEYAVEDKDNL